MWVPFSVPHALLLARPSTRAMRTAWSLGTLIGPNPTEVRDAAVLLSGANILMLLWCKETGLQILPWLSGQRGLSSLDSAGPFTQYGMLPQDKNEQTNIKSKEHIVWPLVLQPIKLPCCCADRGAGWALEFCTACIKCNYHFALELYCCNLASRLNNYQKPIVLVKVIILFSQPKSNNPGNLTFNSPEFLKLAGCCLKPACLHSIPHTVQDCVAACLDWEGRGWDVVKYHLAYEYDAI